MDVYQRERFHELIMVYAAHSSQTEANALTGGFPAAGWHELDFGGTVVGTNASGLAAQTYTASVIIDGAAPIALSVDGTTATTFTLVISAVNALLGANGTMQISPDGDLEIVSATTGPTSSVVITDVDLFATLAGYVSMGSMYIGATTALDILNVNELDGINIGNAIREHFNGLIHTIPNKPILPISAVSNTTIYNDNSDGAWKYYWNDVAVA